MFIVNIYIFIGIIKNYKAHLIYIYLSYLFTSIHQMNANILKYKTFRNTIETHKKKNIKSTDITQKLDVTLLIKIVEQK